MCLTFPIMHHPELIKMLAYASHELRSQTLAFHRAPLPFHIDTSFHKATDALEIIVCIIKYIFTLAAAA